MKYSDNKQSGTSTLEFSSFPYHAEPKYVKLFTEDSLAVIGQDTRNEFIRAMVLAIRQ